MGYEFLKQSTLYYIFGLDLFVLFRCDTFKDLKLKCAPKTGELLQVAHQSTFSFQCTLKMLQQTSCICQPAHETC